MGGAAEFTRLVRSDLLFSLGYSLLWVGLFAVFRGDVSRKAVLVFFHAASLLVVAIVTVGYRYLESTGSTLDWNVLVFYLATLGEVKNIIASEAP